MCHSFLCLVQENDREREMSLYLFIDFDTGLSLSTAALISPQPCGLGSKETTLPDIARKIKTSLK